MEKKVKKTDEDKIQNSSPTCFANSDELRDEYKKNSGSKTKRKKKISRK